MMRKIPLCFFLLVNSLNAALISQVICDGSVGSSYCLTGTQSSADYRYASASVSGDSVQVWAAANQGHSASATAMFSEDLVFTVTSGPAQGFLVPCAVVSKDYFLGDGSASASDLTAPGRGTFSYCGPNGGAAFTLGVAQSIEIFVSASVMAVGYANGAQANASASITGYKIYDSSYHLAPDATFSFGDVSVQSVPEPGSGLFLVGGFVMLLFTRGKMLH